MSEAATQPTHELQPEHIDALTGFANRAWIDEYLPKYTQEKPGEVAVLFLDLDDLKIANDEGGHDAGDELIRKAARTTNGSVRRESPDRPGDVVGRLARYGGDELVAVLLGVTSEDDLAIVKQRLQAKLLQEGVKASIGGAIHDKDKRETSSELLKRADVAMIKDKEERKKARYEALPRHKRVAAKFGARMLRYAGINPPRQ